MVLCFIDAIITKDKQRILLHTSVALCKNIDDNDKTILSDYIENTCPWNVKRYPEVVALNKNQQNIAQWLYQHQMIIGSC